MSFPRYAEYKDSGVEWLGEVPGHWAIVPMKYLVRLQSGGTPSKEDETYWGGPIPWASAKDMKTDVLGDTEDHITNYALECGAASLLDVGAVLVVVRGMILARTFPVAVTSVPLAINQDLKGVIPGQQLISEYLAWYLRGTADESLRRLDEAGHGTKALRMDAWISVEIALPPLPEQSAIAAFLDRETAKIDASVAEQEKLITLLAEKRQAVISHAVTKGPNPAAPMKDSGIEWLGEVPEHWEVVRLKFLADVQSGVAKGRDLAETDTIEVPYLRVANVQDGYLDLDDIATIQIARHELSRYSLIPGDVLMNEGGDFDKLGRGHIWRGEIDPCIHQNHVFAVRPDGIEPEWLNLLTSADCGRFYFMTRSKQSTNLASISSTNIQEFPLVCPPAAERRVIVEHVTAEMARLDTLITEAQRAIDLLKEHRSALISAAVTGKIDVRSQSAEVIPFTPRQRRNLLAAEVVRRCHNDNTFGRTKAHKMFYFLNIHIGIGEFGGHYERWIAGPYDAGMMKSVMADLENAAWFREVQDGERYFYRRLAKFAEVRAAFDEAWADRKDEIVRFIGLLRPLDTQQIEVIATLFAAWNDFLLEGQTVDDARLINEVTTNWHNSKKAIPDRAWREGLRWMRKTGVIPAGTGSHTHQQMGLGL